MSTKRQIFLQLIIYGSLLTGASTAAAVTGVSTKVIIGSILVGPLGSLVGSTWEKLLENFNNGSPANGKKSVHHSLFQVIGRSIAMTLRLSADKNEYKEFEAKLNKMANVAEKNWLITLKEDDINKINLQEVLDINSKKTIYV